jgi:drug/metabolite transporter (DMT)-like permease
MIPLALVFAWPAAVPGAGTLGALVGLALLSTALAYVLYFRILAVAGATNLLLVTFLIPVTAIWLGIAFLGETLAARHLLGMALIGAGLAAMDGRIARALSR